MIDLYVPTSETPIGSITDADLKVLQDALEEEGPDDTDYYITAETIDLIADGRATGHLVDLLRKALGEAAGVDVIWKRR